MVFHPILKITYSFVTLKTCTISLPFDLRQWPYLECDLRDAFRPRRKLTRRVRLLTCRVAKEAKVTFQILT
jgi:hypothetical protein